MRIFKEIIKPTLVLMIICGVVAALLAYTYNVTGVGELGKGISAADLETYKPEVLPTASKLVNANVTLDDPTILGVYADESKNGLAVHLLAKGYGGPESLNVLIGLDKDGAFTGAKFIAIAETAGLGTKITEKSFIDKFIGKSSKVTIGTDVDTIASATKSSEAFAGAVNKAFDVFSQVKGDILG